MNLSEADLPWVILDVSPRTNLYVVGTYTGKVLLVSGALYLATWDWECQAPDWLMPARMWVQDLLVRVPADAPSWTLPILPDEDRPLWVAPAEIPDEPGPLFETVYPARRKVRLADGVEALTRLMAWAPRSHKWCVWENDNAPASETGA